MQKAAPPSPARVALAAAIEAVQQHEATGRELEQQRQRLQAGVYEAIEDAHRAKQALGDFERTLSAHFLAEAQGKASEKPPSRRQLEDAVEEAEVRLQARRDAQEACAAAIRDRPWQESMAKDALKQAIAAVLAADGREAARAVAQHVAALQRDLAGWGQALRFLQDQGAFERNPEVGGLHGRPIEDDIRWTCDRLFTAPAAWGDLGGSDCRAAWHAQALDASAPWREAVAALATDPEAPLPAGPARTVALVGKSPRLVGSAA